MIQQAILVDTRQLHSEQIDCGQARCHQDGLFIFAAVSCGCATSILHEAMRLKKEAGVLKTPAS